MTFLFRNIYIIHQCLITQVAKLSEKLEQLTIYFIHVTPRYPFANIKKISIMSYSIIKI